MSSSSNYDLHDVRFIGAIAGRYAMPERRNGLEGKVPAYACRLRSISTRHAVVFGPVVGKQGEVIAAHFDEFGIVRGKVARLLEFGFILDLALSPVERDNLGAKIIWQKRHLHEQLPDKREHKRIIPRDPRSFITLGDGTGMPCFVMNISQSGIAVSAPISPDIGTPMAVGRLVGRVVRYLELGFAMQLLQVQSFEEIEALIKPPSK